MHPSSPRTSPRFTRVPPVTGHKFFLLFLFLLGYLVYYPYAADASGLRYHIFRILGSAVTLLSVYAISFRRGLVFFALLLAVPALLQRTVLFRADASILSHFAIFLSFAFDVFVIVVIFRRVFAREEPDAETVFGALCIYLMVAFSFASLYTLIATLQTNAFYLDPLTNSHKSPNAFDFVYYSFGTMTSLGAAGIVAVSPQLRSLSVIEAILGVLYLAVLISRLMGAYRSNRHARQKDDAEP
jgi:hypothetical protein